MSLHWNRHHIGEMVRMVHFIDKGLINNMEDLRYELERIKLSNKAGSLACRFSFLAHPQSVSEKDKMICENSDDDIELEMHRKKIGHCYL